MAVSTVHLSHEAFMVCMTHALSTEKEEIVGLLLGEIDEKNHISYLQTAIILRRIDKLPDRVEISTEQLATAAETAEALSQKTGRSLRVLGWYHSHPHITVWPSHVDLQTQAMYQLLAEGFVGLIFSVFDQSKSNNSQIQLTCFQSINQSVEGEPPLYERLGVPIHIVPSSHISRLCLRALLEIPHQITQEEEEAYMKTTINKNLSLTKRLQNDAFYTIAVCDHMEIITGPLMQSLENKLKRNKKLIAEKQTEKQMLLKKIEELNAK